MPTNDPEYYRRYYLANRDRIRAMRRVYYLRHEDRLRGYQRAYYRMVVKPARIKAREEKAKKASKRKRRKNTSGSPAPVQLPMPALFSEDGSGTRDSAEVSGNEFLAGHRE